MLLMFNLPSQKNSSNQPDYDEGINLSSVQIPEEPKRPDPPQPKPQQRTAQSTYTTHIAFVDETNMPTMDELKTTDISDRTMDGLPPDGGATSSNNTNSERDIKEVSGERAVEKNLPTYDAQYPGGIEKFTDFLRKYLNTPDDLEAGEKKVVIIRLMVDVDGTISKTEIIQSGGEKYDKEVIRVLRKMPKWIPAMQNGIKVGTYFTQPVTFIGIEE